VQADPATDLTDLMLRSAEGDRSAFRALYERTAPKLLASARRILTSKTAAEDAVQEAYVRIWQRAADFDPAIASPVAWMTTIARYAAIDALRRGAERVARASDDVDAVIGGLAGPEANGDPLQARSLAGCVEGLAADRRAMVILAYCYGWSREDLATRFDRPVATVKTLLRRSLIALKDCLGE
jgi:RNA polymerase sigma-70 factor (ECF subfamily)